MKIATMIGLTLMISVLLCAQQVSAQADSSTVRSTKKAGSTGPSATVKAAVPIVQADKTNTAWDILSDFYQLSLSDLTGNTKGVTFVSSIYAIESGFNPNSKKIASYFENNFQPDVTLGYKNNFQNLNTSFGFKFGITQTDAKHSKKLNDDPVLLQELDSLTKYTEPIRRELLKRESDQKKDPAMLAAVIKGNPPDSPEAKLLIKAYVDGITQQFDQQVKELTVVELTGDTSKLSPDIKVLFDNTIRKLPGYLALAAHAKSRLEYLSRQVANGYNVTLNPMVTYDFTHGGWQGVNLGANGIKGFNYGGDTTHTLQIVAKFNYIIGADTIVSKINTARKQITDQLGINQVLASSMIKSVSKNVPTPWLEASLTGSYNYVYAGLKPKEKNIQPALNFKIGLLLGKSTWFTIPVSYNFGTRTTTALVSLTANIGTAPF
jgi:hypothetical protein